MKIVLFSIFIIAINIFGQTRTLVKDVRDGQSYETIQIGRQTWMAENLRYKTKNSICYNNDLLNCKKFGRLYTIYDAVVACPQSWHLPSESEWFTLFDFLCEGSGPSETQSSKRVFQKLSYQGSTGFNALLAGSLIDEAAYKQFSGLGLVGYFWTSTRELSTGQEMVQFDGQEVYAYITYTLNPRIAFSARCIRD